MLAIMNMFYTVNHQNSVVVGFSVVPAYFTTLASFLTRIHQNDTAHCSLTSQTNTGIKSDFLDNHLSICTYQHKTSHDCELQKHLINGKFCGHQHCEVK